MTTPYPSTVIYPGSSTYPGASTSGPFTVTADTSNQPPRMVLAVTALSGSTVTVFRVDAAGNQSPVRSANPATLNSGAWTGYDYEAPFNEPISYKAVSDTGSIETTGTVELLVSVPWLIHPGVPSLSVQFTLGKRPGLSRGTKRGLHTVLGRSDPVPRVDGSRPSGSFDLTINTYSVTQEIALDALLADEQTLLMQIALPNISRQDYAWVSVDAWSQVPAVDFYGDQHTVWTLPCQIVSAPSGMLQAQFAWSDLVGSYPDWGTVANDFASWNDVILDAPSI